MWRIPDSKYQRAGGYDSILYECMIMAKGSGKQDRDWRPGKPVGSRV